uniref:Mitochondrial basic amino acids transporter n=1 Tax=Timema genevievae TaxID=629358 RepID=A0A7R9JYE6_TIMGE|nr:unnamed protein product [Timema genevievae]
MESQPPAADRSKDIPSVSQRPSEETLHFVVDVTKNKQWSLECKLYNHVPPSTVQPKSRKAAYQHLFEVPPGLDRRLPTLGKIVSAFKICYERSLLRRDALVIASRLEPWRSSNTGTLSSTYTTSCFIFRPIAHLLRKQDGAGFYRWMHRCRTLIGRASINGNTFPCEVCLQTQDFRNPQYRGTIHCVSSLLKKEGMKGLYKGMSSPMSGVALVNAIVFGVNGNVQRRMSDPDSMKSLCLAGASAGFVQSFVCSPMELVKTRIQIQQNNRSSYKNPLDCLVKVARTEGYSRGVFKGLGVTILRDVPAVCSYFLAYELMTRSYAAPISTLHMLIAGGLAGTFSWVVTYPVDVIKSRLQADGVGKYDGLMDCFRKSVRSEGFSFLTRGLTSTILRAFPTNAATFTVVTWVFRWCNNHPTVDIDNSVYCVPMSYEDYVINVTMRKDSPDNILGVKTFSFKEKKDGYLRSIIQWRKTLLHGLVGDFNHHLQPMKERPANKVSRVDLDETESKVMALFFKNVGQIHFESHNIAKEVDVCKSN